MKLQVGRPKFISTGLKCLSDRIELWRRAIALTKKTSTCEGPFYTAGYGKGLIIEYNQDGCNPDIIVWKTEPGSDEYAIIELTTGNSSKLMQMQKYSKMDPK